ncbi:MAG: hypothetical protein WKF88_10305 [Ferruginibacter sp.]
MQDEKKDGIPVTVPSREKLKTDNATDTGGGKAGAPTTGAGESEEANFIVKRAR